MSKMSNMSRLWGGKKGKAKETTCGFCRQPLLKDKTHSGNFYSVSALAEEEGGGKIHTVSLSVLSIRCPSPDTIARANAFRYWQTKIRMAVVP